MPPMYSREYVSDGPSTCATWLARDKEGESHHRIVESTQERASVTELPPIL